MCSTKTAGMLLIIIFLMTFGIGAGIHIHDQNRIITSQTNQIDQVVMSNHDLTAVMESMAIPVTVTAYNPVPEQTDSTPFQTASMQMVREGIVALSRDLEYEYDLQFGDKIYLIIDGKEFGPFEFQDRMNRRFKKRVDIFMWKEADAWKFGKQKGALSIKKMDTRSKIEVINESKKRAV